MLYLFVTCAKNLIICDFETIDKWILADKACHVTDFSNIMYYDVITISY